MIAASSSADGARNLKQRNSTGRESDMTSKCLIKRKLPPAPKTATKTIRNDRMLGYGAFTYESPVPASVMDLRITPTKSDSKAAQAEREIKEILDLAREGKTASEIARKTGYKRSRVVQVVGRFAEYGAKLAPEKPKKREAPEPPIDKRTSPRYWTQERINELTELHAMGLSYQEMADKLGTTKGSVGATVSRLMAQGALPTRSSRYDWPQEDVDKLIELKAKGLTMGEIADKLGRNPKSCYAKWRVHVVKQSKMQDVFRRMADSGSDD